MLLKWIFDRVFSFLGLLLLSWLFLVIAVLIKIYMPGPILFRQKRVGKNGKLFTIHKFRSMNVNSGGSSVTFEGESRITKVGAMLRKYKLDELPELWDVLIGNMSFVGPRPDLPVYLERLTNQELKIMSLRPGITGPASLKYRDEERLISQYIELSKKNGDKRTREEIALSYNDNIIFPDKIRLNLYYLNNYSFTKDIQMIFFTIICKKMRYAGEMI